nr:uncharacterized protein LOC106991716 [Ovis aries]
MPPKSNALGLPGAWVSPWPPPWELTLQTRDTRYLCTGPYTTHRSWAARNIQASSKNSHRGGWSAVTEAVTRQNTINFHKRTYGVGFKKRAPWARQENGKFTMKGGPPDVCISTRPNRAVGQGAAERPTRIRVQLSRRHGGDPPNKFYRRVPYVPVTTFKNLRLLWMRTVDGPIKLLNFKKTKIINKQPNDEQVSATHTPVMSLFTHAAQRSALWPPPPRLQSAPAVITHPQALWFLLPSVSLRQRADPPAGIRVLRIKLDAWICFARWEEVKESWQALTAGPGGGDLPGKPPGSCAAGPPQCCVCFLGLARGVYSTPHPTQSRDTTTTLGHDSPGQLLTQQQPAVLDNTGSVSRGNHPVSAQGSQLISSPKHQQITHSM